MVFGEHQEGQGAQGCFSSCDNIPCENNPSENTPGEEEGRPAVGGGQWIYNSEGNPSHHITHLVADYVEHAFQDKNGKVYPHRLNLWIADFAERMAESLGSVESAFDETRAFCGFIHERYSGQRFYARQGSFQRMETEWVIKKAAPTAGCLETAVSASQALCVEASSESLNPALEWVNLAQLPYSTELAFKSPALEILPSVPTELEAEPQCPMLSPESQSIELPAPAAENPVNVMPTDPDRLQWLVAQAYAKASKLQRKDLDTLWAKKPSSEALGPMLRFFSRMNGRNACLVGSARAELDRMGIVRKSDIPALPWLDSGELSPAAGPKQPAAGDGTLPLPLSRDRLKRALRKLNKEPNLHLRFEIDGWFTEIEGDQQFHSEMIKKFGAAAVEEALNGNN